MENLPVAIGILFGLTTALTIFLFYKAGGSRAAVIVLLLWLAAQAILSRSGFYENAHTLPPRILYLLLPPILAIAVLFFTTRGRSYLDGWNLAMLTLLHIIRIPVELILFWLFLNKAVPRAMTFDGRNFDILAGLTAPVIYLFGFVRRQIDRRVLLAWNFIGMGLLLNIVITAVLSAPSPFQRFAFDQPNIAITHFPFVWLPCCLVPLVLLSHLVVIRQLVKR